ncbi:Protein CBG27195 [Caenorhabditis briggsae]|uniref:Protein CBG27195 n=1 Tax=Caenorhabditis briggsae TaxID=6238 RepID=B6IL25_CAEBR|nr:Protein CBG27195 [Caenorhabditis briggsae]CAS00658.1 Protein CBG27195 [Caenorhabditis briggsae]
MNQKGKKVVYEVQMYSI